MKDSEHIIHLIADDRRTTVFAATVQALDDGCGHGPLPKIVMRGGKFYLFDNLHWNDHADRWEGQYVETAAVAV